MSFPEFGKIIQEGSKTTFPQFGEIIDQPSRTRSIINAPIKGAFKGISEQAEMSPFSAGPIPQKLGERIIEKFLPTQEKSLEKGLERGGRIGTYLTGPGKIGGKVAQAATGAVAGQLTEMLGGPEWAQKAAEFAGMVGPTLTAKIPLKKAQERLFDFARKKGFSEKEIAPLMNDDRVLKTIGKVAFKGNKTKDIMQAINEKTGLAYDSIREEGANLPPLQGKQLNTFLEDLQQSINKIRPKHRRAIQEDLNDLLNSEVRFNDLVDFYQDVNATTKGIVGGKAILNSLKGPVQRGQSMISPELANDYLMTNQLYAQRANVTDFLKPSQIDTLLNLGEIGGAATAISTLNIPMMGGVIGAGAARLLAREILLNPRLKNLSTRMFVNFSHNKIGIGLKLYEDFVKELRKSDPELAEDLNKISQSNITNKKNP